MTEGRSVLKSRIGIEGLFVRKPRSATGSMKIHEIHPWQVTPQEAREIQSRIRPRLRLNGAPRRIRRIAGVDVACTRSSRTLWAGVVVLQVPGMEVLEERWAESPAALPYIPGLLSFREIPALLRPLEALEIEPDVIFCDGQGIAHPRGLGLAAHLGLVLRTPTVGCAKSRLIGTYAPVGEARGEQSPLRYRGGVVGAVVRTRTGVRPMFISPGYGLGVRRAVRLVLDHGGPFRIPTPTRLAHQLVGRVRRSAEAGETGPRGKGH